MRRWERFAVPDLQDWNQLRERNNVETATPLDDPVFTFVL